MLDYFVKVLLFQTLFLAVYDILLKKETFFQWNRAYLISTSLLAYIIPLIPMQSVAQNIPEEYVIMLPEVVLSPQTVLKEQFDWSALLFTSLQWLFLTGVIIAIIIFGVKLTKLIRTIRQNEKEKKPNYSLVYVNSKAAFSFFNYIFLGKQISKDNTAQIIEHELVHVKQKHSLDLLFFELQKIVCWFNPLSYIYQKRISELHEFIADSKAIKNNDKATYFQNLLVETFGTHKISFINPFLKHSLIKKRIVMLNKAKSKQLVKFKYLLLIPLLAGMLVYTSCENREESFANKNEKRNISLYMKNARTGEIKEIKPKNKGYFDVYMLGAEPSNAKKISFNDLNTEEKAEFQDISERFKDGFKGRAYSYEIYEHNNGEKSIKETIHWNQLKSTEKLLETEDVPYSLVEETPIFPNSENVSDTKTYFNKKMQQHIRENFDTKLANTLGLSAGKKRIFVLFKITKTGAIEITGVRAPHKKLEAEAKRVVNLLPKMTPGKHSGKPVNVPYQLPIVFEVK